VAVSVGPSYATLREETLAMVTELLKVTPPQYVVELFDLMIESMDMPKAEKFRQRIKALKDAPPPPNPQLEIEIQKLSLQMRKQMREEFDSHFKAIQAVAQAESMEAGAQLNEYTSFVDRYQKQIELQQQQEQMQQQAQAQQQQEQGA